jgi:hypothetical protein
MSVPWEEKLVRSLLTSAGVPRVGIGPFWFGGRASVVSRKPNPVLLPQAISFLGAGSWTLTEMMNMSAAPTLYSFELATLKNGVRLLS